MSKRPAPVTWITGCASGLGRHLAGRLLKEGHRVVATDVDEAGLARAASEDQWPAGSVWRAPLDVRDPVRWRALLGEVESQWGVPDNLFNVAGYLLPGAILETDEPQVDRHLDVNVKGVVRGCRVLGEAMRREGRGHLINVASLAGVAPVPGIGLYSTAKFAVRGFSLALAQELAGTGVAVTVVCPDAIETPMLKLQESWDEAALTFSGSRILGVEEVSQALVAALEHRRPEVLLPTGRGWLAKLGNLFPRFHGRLAAILRKRGRKRQRERRGI